MPNDLKGCAGRISDLRDFYSLLAGLSEKISGARRLETCSGRLTWPSRGVYFFMEEGETRSDSGKGLRIVRVGTHALKSGSAALLWTRLSQHRGQTNSGGGNHRGSIFRLIVGTALIARDVYNFPTWGVGNNAPAHVRSGELALEQAVSKAIRAMPFLWLGIADVPGPASLRGVIERNSIALLSNFAKEPLDPPSSNWLGSFCNRERVRRSGLWNSNHVEETYDPLFLRSLENLTVNVGSFA